MSLSQTVTWIPVASGELPQPFRLVAVAFSDRVYYAFSDSQGRWYEAAGHNLRGREAPTHWAELKHPAELEGGK